jgi:hypothetical protein
MGMHLHADVGNVKFPWRPDWLGGRRGLALDINAKYKQEEHLIFVLSL